jgi:hypothetical protein
MNKYFWETVVAILYFLAKPAMLLAFVAFVAGSIGTHFGYF